MFLNKKMVSATVILLLVMIEPTLNQEGRAITTNDVELELTASTITTNMTLWEQGTISQQGSNTIREKITSIQEQNLTMGLQATTEAKINGLIYSSGYDNIYTDCIVIPVVNYYNGLLAENGSRTTISYQEALVTFTGVNINFTNVLKIKNTNYELTAFYYKLGDTTYKAKPNETIEFKNATDIIHQSFYTYAEISDATQGIPFIAIGGGLIAIGIITSLGMIAYKKRTQK